MRFNPQKCKILSVSSKSPILFNYNINGINLERVQQMKDLGVMVDSRLNWNAHIVNTVSKANRVLWLLKRALGYNAPPTVCKQLFISFVRSTLEYCPQVWGGTTKGNIATLERVQRSATRFMLGYPDMGYKERLDILGILPLSFRREILDLSFFFKCMNSEYNLNTAQYVETLPSVSRTTRSASAGNMLRPKLCRTETFARSYFNRVTHMWNLLPNECRLCTDTAVFKRNVNRFYGELLEYFNPDDVCTWRVRCTCPSCRLV